MAGTRKRKTSSTPAKTKKAKAEDEDKEQKNGEEGLLTITSTDDAPAAAAEEAPKEDEKDAEIVAEAEVNGRVDEATTSPAVDGETDPETKSSSANVVVVDDVEDSPQNEYVAAKVGCDLFEEAPAESTSREENGAVKGEGDLTMETEKAPALPTTPPKSTSDQADAVANPGTTVDKVQTSNPTSQPMAMVTPVVQQPGASPHTPSASSAAAAVPADAIVEEKREVSSLYVGRVIGQGGEMIRDLQARSGCKIDVDQNVPQGAPRIITYRGTRSTVDFAIQLVTLLCTDKGKDADLPLGRAVMVKMQVPHSAVGKIIGRGGEMVRKLQNESKAKIQVDRSGAGMDANLREVTITGENDSVAKAQEMINCLCANPAVDSMQALQMLMQDKAQNGGSWGGGGGGQQYPNYPQQGQGMGGGMYGMGRGNGYPSQQAENRYGQNFGGGVDAVGGMEADVFPCAKMYMGRVIGQKGVTINDLQKRSGCDIQINQNVPVGQDCQITIRGSRHGIEQVKQMLQEIIEVGPGHPYAGGRGQVDQYHGGVQHGGQYANQQPSFYNMNPAIQANQHPGYPPQQYGILQQHSYQQPYEAVQYGSQAVHQPQTSPWRAATAADGQVYYYNEITQQTQWERPV